MTKWGAALAIAALGWCAPVGAQTESSVRTLEHGDWASTVAALQRDPHAEGRAVHVVVESGAERVPCGRHLLVLDAYGQLAFQARGCDPQTQATELRLVSRRALFELGDVVARPRIIQVVAFELRQATAQGRATAPVVAELHCSVALRPFLLDLLHGTQVRATPDRFEVRAVGDGAEVHVAGDAWTVRSGSMRFEYELVDRRTGEEVLREAVTLSCSSESTSRATHDGALEAPPEAAPRVPVQRVPVQRVPVQRVPVQRVPVQRVPVPRIPDVAELAPGSPIERTLSAGAPSRYHGRCGGEHAPEHVYTLHVGAPMWIALRVESRFDAILSLRNAEGRELDCSVVSGDPGQVRVPRAWAQLAPGSYYVIVDGASGGFQGGWYRLGMDFVRPH